MSTKYIFITGGVCSSLGKGIAASALGALLQGRGYSVRLRKLDPYLNIDPGTLSPYEHGEVFVTDDGTEADLDLGHYERFTGVSATRDDYITSGKVYLNVLNKERRGDYLGATVQVIPHITDEIQNFIKSNTDGIDFVLCEIGGTVGDIEGLPYLEAIRQMRNTLGRDRTMFIHLTLLPYIATAGEVKTKPTQHSVKELLHVGIQPDLLMCRSDRPISPEAKRKLGLFCNVPSDNVIAALDAKNIYEVPLQYGEEGLDRQVCRYFGLPEKSADIARWQLIQHKIANSVKTVKVGVVGKYIKLLDAYKSLIEALTHASIANDARLQIEWLDPENTEKLQDGLAKVDAILVPGGFGERGTEGKMEAIRFARENDVPFLGICFGMQLSVIEACRNQLGLLDASSTEFGPTKEPVVGLMTEWYDEKSGVSQVRDEQSDLGGTMRVGSFPCVLKEGSLISQIYGNQTTINERHRHRYEVNNKYLSGLESVGVVCSGMSTDGVLPKIIERPANKWFVGVQFHPELKSRSFDPHPLFVSFIKAAL